MTDFSDMLAEAEAMRESVTRVLHVVRVVRDTLAKDNGEFQRIGDFVQQLRLVGASLRRLADTIDREADKFLVS